MHQNSVSAVIANGVIKCSEVPGVTSSRTVTCNVEQFMSPNSTNICLPRRRVKCCFRYLHSHWYREDWKWEFTHMHSWAYECGAEPTRTVCIFLCVQPYFTSLFPSSWAWWIEVRAVFHLFQQSCAMTAVCSLQLSYINTISEQIKPAKTTKFCVSPFFTNLKAVKVPITKTASYVRASLDIPTQTIADPP